MCPGYKLTNAYDSNSLNRTDMIITQILTVILSVGFNKVVFKQNAILHFTVLLFNNFFM